MKIYLSRVFLPALIQAFVQGIPGAQAATPQTVQFQGKLVAGTNLVNGPVGLTLRIYTNATTGAFLFEDSNTVNVVDGVYSASMGAHPILGTLTNALAAGEAYVEVRVNGVPLAPRERMAAAPYALDGDFVRKNGDTMTGALGINGAILSIYTTEDRGGGPRSMLIIEGGEDVEVGSAADGYNNGAAVGNRANGNDHGAAMGFQANAILNGAALGNLAEGSDSGVAIGSEAKGQAYGSAVGNRAHGRDYGVALGEGSVGYDSGVAVGSSAEGSVHGIAVGNFAIATPTNIAIGYRADTAAGSERIAIGHEVVSEMDDSATIRGTLYLDGSTGVLVRSTFGSGNWTPLLDGYARTSAVAAAYVKIAGDTMTGNLVVTNAILEVTRGGLISANMLTIGGGDYVEIGNKANASYGGLAIGYEAYGNLNGLAIGTQADGTNAGLAIGYVAKGWDQGASVGYQAKGSRHGVAVGYRADATNYGLALGHYANGANSGVAIGAGADGQDVGLAIGTSAKAGNTCLAMGHGARASGGSGATAIGFNVTNSLAGTTRVRGDLYLDGGSKIYTNASFGSYGSWGVKAFTIDHPLDPKNKLLRHYCLEGPQVWNVYAGTASLDPQGEATVELPAYFEKLNVSPQYLLTAVGASMPNLFIKQKVSHNRFAIGGGAPGGEVCWEVKALRNDPAALEDLRQRPVEQLKSALPPGAP